MFNIQGESWSCIPIHHLCIVHFFYVYVFPHLSDASGSSPFDCTECWWHIMYGNVFILNPLSLSVLLQFIHIVLVTGFYMLQTLLYSITSFV